MPWKFPDRVGQYPLAYHIALRTALASGEGLFPIGERSNWQTARRRFGAFVKAARLDNPTRWPGLADSDIRLTLWLRPGSTRGLLVTAKPALSAALKTALAGDKTGEGGIDT